MTINKYFVLVPKDCDKLEQKTNHSLSDKETQRQQAVQQAQNNGGLTE